jgi:predicted N-acetyltransferase YhbS
MSQMLYKSKSKIVNYLCIFEKNAMEFSLFKPSDTQKIIALFTRVFSASEGEAEGKNIGNLVANLMTKTKSQDLMGCIAKNNESIVGCIFFSRFIVPTGQAAFILSPVAIATDFQRRGIGQQLINYGLDQLRSLNIKLVFTYGDPDFYSKTGFKQISESVVKAPYVLSQPIGWLAQSLVGEPIPTIQGPTKCVEALGDSKYW